MLAKYSTDCPEGYFGINCVENCSMTCRVPGGCNKVTGQCLGGCQAGWTGDRCKKGKRLQ